MRSFIFSAKSVILMLVALPLSLCSNNNDDKDGIDNFDPIVINFTEDFFTDCIDGLVGYTKATITIDDNCGAGCTNANLYEGINVISTVENTVLGKDLEDLVIGLTEDSSLIRVWSCEGAIVSILLE